MNFLCYTWPAMFRRVPIDHGYALYGALSWNLRVIHEGAWQVCPLSGKAQGRELKGPGSLRIRGPLAPSMLGALNGARLRVASRDVFLGDATLSEVRPATTIRSRFVTIKNSMDADALLSNVVERVHALIEHIPEITIGRRRVMKIGGRKVVGFEVTISGLDEQESLLLQEQGIGGRRRMGGGVFESVEVGCA